VQVVYLPLRDISSPPAGLLASADVVLTLSTGLARLGMYPAVDPSASSSEHLDPAVVGSEHVEIASRARDALLAMSDEQLGASDPAAFGDPDRALVARARRLRRFLTQPFFTAEPWIRGRGQFVPVEATLRGCRAILDGELDDVPEEALYMIGAIEQVRK
jgi:F-type H+-transporting ATPase subunit beta